MSDSLNDQTLGSFFDALASKAPTPGGGSVAAFSGAMAAGLVGMVCALTIGKKQYAAFEDDLRGIQERAEALRIALQELAQADVQVFGRLAAAYKLPRVAEADVATRQSAIQAVTRQAAEVPLRTAQAAAALLPLCTELVSRCSRLIVSDVGVAAVLARATVQSAILNVEINLSGLEDHIYVNATRAQIADMVIGLSEETDGVLAIVRDRINK